MKFGKYLKKRYNEDLAPNQVEIVARKIMVLMHKVQ
jgi:hypothetical protein